MKQQTFFFLEGGVTPAPPLVDQQINLKSLLWRRGNGYLTVSKGQEIEFFDPVLGWLNHQFIPLKSSIFYGVNVAPSALVARIIVERWYHPLVMQCSTL